MSTTRMGPDSAAPAKSTTTATATNQRRSCIFCRARKIRCSGGHVCSACRERNINCIYGPESRKGRPRRNTKPSTGERAEGATATTPPQSQPQPADAGVDPVPPAAGRAQAPPGRGAGSERGPPTSAGSGSTLGQDLEHMFHGYFIDRRGSRSNLFQNSIALFQEQQLGCGPPEDDTSSSPAAHAHAPRLTYDGLLSFLAHDMVEMLLRFGQLGGGGGEEFLPGGQNRNFYVAHLASDTTPTMFDAGRSALPSLLTTLGKHSVLQLVDFWFLMHPLSPLLSKTLLVSSIKDETVDPALLAIILADTSPAGLGLEGPDALAQLAADQLRLRTLPLEDDQRLSVAQALALLGWREMCRGCVRRATCYLGYTCRIVSQLHKSWAAEERGRMDSVRLNGIDVREVEREILCNLYWLCLSTTTWSFMQIQDSFSLLLPHEIPDFPSTDESLSPTIRLDQASNNISTIQAQVRNMQWLWALTHITSTVAYTYSLFLHAAESDEDDDLHHHRAPRPGMSSWQTQHIHKLHHLPRACFDSGVLSRQIRRIVLQSIEDVEREVTDVTSQSFLQAAYHTIAIHMLFSRPRRCGGAMTALTLSTVQAFNESAAALRAVAQRCPPQPSDPVSLLGLMGAGRADGARTLALGLEICSRALAEIQAQFHTWFTEGEDSSAVAHGQLVEHARAMHQLCKTDYLMQCGSAIQPVKKRLKQLHRSLTVLSLRPPPATILDEATFGEQPTMAPFPASPQSQEQSQDPTYASIPMDLTGDGPLPSLAAPPARDALDTSFYFPLGDPDLDLGSLFETGEFRTWQASAPSSVPSRSNTQASDEDGPHYTLAPPAFRPPRARTEARRFSLDTQLTSDGRSRRVIDADGLWVPPPHDAPRHCRPTCPSTRQGSPDAHGSNTPTSEKTARSGTPAAPGLCPSWIFGLPWQGQPRDAILDGAGNFF